MPPLRAWTRNLLIALAGAYVVELLLAYTGLDARELAWHALGHGFSVYQPFTRYLVQGDNAAGVLFGLLTIALLFAPMWEMGSHRQLRDGMIAGAIGGAVLPLLADLAGFDRGVVMGWTTLAFVAIPTLFGLLFPEQTIRLMFVIPVNGRFVLWLTAVLCALYFLTAPALVTAEPLGTWLGVYGWWQLLGPPARKRALRKKAAGIEKELRKFQVIEGGKAQGDQGGRDDWVN